MSKPFRRWGIVLGTLLSAILVGMILLRPRPIRIPLADGTTLSISAITTGTLHSRPEPISWKAFRTQVAARKWGWPTLSLQTSEPYVMLWIDGLSRGEPRHLTLVDRHGWRWGVSSGFPSGGPDFASFPPIETDGTARLEVHGENGLLGTAVIPLPSVVPITAPAPLPTDPPIRVTSGTPAPLPIHRAAGPLETTLHSFEVRDIEGQSVRLNARFQLEALWNGRPIVPQIGFLAVTDRFGRREVLSPQGDDPLWIPLPPHEAIWDLHFQVLRNLDVPLDPEEIVVVTPPKPVEGETLFQQSGVNQGRAWSLTLIPSGTASLKARFSSTALHFHEHTSVILVEFDPQHSLRIRLETLDAKGENFPATEIPDLPGPNFFAFRSPEFDATKGHQIRIGFDEPRLVQFTIRADEVWKDRLKPGSRK